MGGCVSNIFSRALRIVMLATEPSEGCGREALGVGGGKLLIWLVELAVATLGAAVGSTGGTPGEKRETCGVLLEGAVSAAASALKDHGLP
jgi:hypothetical protein